MKGLAKRVELLFRRKRFAADLDEEMSFHRAQAEKELIANGMTAEQARFAASREFGNATRVKEQSHEVVGFGFETVAQDLRYAFRQLRQTVPDLAQQNSARSAACQTTSGR